MGKPAIVSDPNIMLGKPVVSGTRITVELILQKLAAGRTVNSILHSYPRLTKAAVLAALEFAADSMKYQVALPVKRKAA